MAIFIELFLMGVGLSMDAFAVSICKGLGMRKVNKKQALVIGLLFGGFQALMPFVGWLLGSQFEKYITSIDHWIAFILLGIIGGKMIVESVKPDKEDDEVKEMDAPLDLKEMLSNERFVSKAPESKVAEEKAKLEKYTNMMEQVKERLKQLEK